MRKTIYSIWIAVFALQSVCGSARAQETTESTGTSSTSRNPLYELLSSTGKIIPDIETNSIMVVDYPFNIEMINEYLAMTDVPTEQVLIQAKIVEVKLEGEHAMGVNWTAFAADGGGHAGQFQIGSSSGGALTQSIPSRAVKFVPLSGDDQTPFTIGLFDENIEVILTALTTALETEILSAPKVTTTNNRRAKIDVVKTVPFVENIEREVEDTDFGQRITITFDYSYADDGVSLSVTPLINPDRSITMSLVPQVKEIIRFVELPGPEEASRPPELPETDVRMAQTKVTVDEGQTLVIGGLIREKVTHGTTKVPLLGDIPFIGGLFKSDLDTKEKTELLIFVTPTIITPNVVARMRRQQRIGVENITKREVFEAASKRIVSQIDDLAAKAEELMTERKQFQEELKSEKKNSPSY